MNREKYLAQRQELTNTAQVLIDEGKLEDANAKMKEIEALDAQYEAAATAKANLDALNKGNQVTDYTNSGVGAVRGQVIDSIENGADDEEFTNSKEYRKAFMNHVIGKEKMPAEFLNADANTKTTDVGVMIPDVVLQRIIEKMETYGQIYSRVTKTAFKGGVTIPTSTVKPVATWVAEGATSDKQKKTTGSITFAYHKLRCAVSVSLEVDVMALEIFERTLVDNVAQAMVKALEASILFGTGTGQPKGIFVETVVTGQNIDIADDADLTIATIEGAEEALPLAYEAGAVWLMNKKTYLKAKTLKGTDGHFIFSEQKGVNGQTVRMLNEREVILTEGIQNITATVTTDTIVAGIFKLDDYILNTNFAMGIREYYDEETEDKIKKSVMLVDGKVVDKNSLVTITKKA